MSDIRLTPFDDGREQDCQCARCGCSVVHVDCWQCGDSGEVEHDSWDGCGEGYFVRCDVCKGRGGFEVCGENAEWCNAHPMKGREDVKRGAVEWFAIERPEAKP